MDDETSRLEEAVKAEFVRLEVPSQGRRGCQVAVERFGRSSRVVWNKSGVIVFDVGPNDWGIRPVTPGDLEAMRGLKK